MKKLLYLTAIAVWFTSCSVDNTQDENSIDFNKVNTRSIEVNGACNQVKLYNDEGDVRGMVEPYVDYESGIVMLKFTTYAWKISSSKLYFGSTNAINSSRPDLFESGQYQLTESFRNNVYEANYLFQIEDVDRDFCLMAILDIKDEDEKQESAFTIGVDVNGKKDLYIKEFVGNCFN